MIPIAAFAVALAISLTIPTVLEIEFAYDCTDPASERGISVSIAADT
jgi:hypothetical protein